MKSFSLSRCLFAGVLGGVSAAASALPYSFSGAVQYGPVPNVVAGHNESDVDIHFFAERLGVVTSGVRVDFAGVGLVDTASLLGNTKVGIGTKIDSYFIHFDPLHQSTVDGEIHFAGKILGVQVAKTALKLGNPMLGSAGTTYGVVTNAYGLEFQPGRDWLNISPDGHTLSFHLYAESPGDRFRVVTQSVPEPFSAAGLGLGLLAMSRRRLRS